MKLHGAFKKNHIVGLLVFQQVPILLTPLPRISAFLP